MRIKNFQICIVFPRFTCIPAIFYIIFIVSYKFCLCKKNQKACPSKEKAPACPVLGLLSRSNFYNVVGLTVINSCIYNRSLLTSLLDFM